MQVVGRMTALAYAIFIFNGLFNVLPGVLLMNIARSFQVDTHIIGYIYSLLIFGNVIAVQANGYLLEKVDIKKELFCGIGVILIAVLGITSATYLTLFALSIFLNGIGSGILTSISSYLIVNLYDAKERSSKLNLLHFTFSVGAIVSPLIAENLINIGIPWQCIYRYPIMFLTFLFILALTTKIQIKKRTLVQEKKGTDKWGLMIYVIAIALFCYMLAEQSFLFWGNTYFVENLSFDMARASSLISLFWVFMAIGRFSSGVILQYISVEKFIIGFSFFRFCCFCFYVKQFRVLGGFYFGCFDGVRVFRTLCLHTFLRNTPA